MSENPKPPKQSPYSPFPFGSPLGLNVSKGTAEASMGNGLTSRTSPSSSSATFLSTLNSSFLKGRVRAKEAYGGKIEFIFTTLGQKSTFYQEIPLFFIIHKCEFCKN